MIEDMKEEPTGEQLNPVSHEDWERWAKEVLMDYRIQFDNHTIGLRLGITQWMFDRNSDITQMREENEQLRARIKALETIQKRNTSHGVRTHYLIQERDGLLQKVKALEDLKPFIQHLSKGCHSGHCECGLKDLLDRHASAEKKYD